MYFIFFYSKYLYWKILQQTGKSLFIHEFDVNNSNELSHNHTRFRAYIFLVIVERFILNYR